MRSSSILTLIGATLAVASPLHFKLHKKAVVWDIVTDIVYVTVTEGQLPQSHPETTVTVKHTHFVNPIPATTSEKVVPTTPPPPPPPSSTPPPPPPPAPPATTEAPAPAPTTQEAVKPVVPTVAPVVQAPAPVVQAAAPVVQAAAPTSFESAAVYYHNLARANHSADPLAWSSSLASSAQQLADTCHFGHNMGINGGGYGQNIDMQGSSDKSAVNWSHADIIASSVTNGWYLAEEANFANKNYWGVANPDTTNPEMRHFTQVVWKSTTTVGCGIKFCGQGGLLGGSTYQWYMVCNYGPSGNYAGEYASNVGKSLNKAGAGVMSPFEKQFGSQ